MIHRVRKANRAAGRGLRRWTQRNTLQLCKTAQLPGAAQGVAEPGSARGCVENGRSPNSGEGNDRSSRLAALSLDSGVQRIASNCTKEPGEYSERNGRQRTGNARASRTTRRTRRASRRTNQIRAIVSALDGTRQVLSAIGFDELFLSYPECAVAIDADGYIIECNAVMLLELGYARSDLIGARLLDFFAPSNARLAEVEIAACLKGVPARFPTQLVRANGTYFIAGLVLLPMRHNGEVIAAAGFIRDITDLEQIANLAQRGQTLMRLAGRLARFGAWSISLPTHTLCWSDELCEILGYPLGSAPPLSVAFDMYSDDRVSMEAAVSRCEEFGEPFDERTAIRRADGEWLQMRAIGEAVRDDSGSIVGVQGAFLDVTAEAEAIAAHLEVEERLSNMARSMSDGIVILGADWVFSYVNPRAELILGHTAAELVGRGMWDVFPEGRGTEFAIAYHRALAEQATTSVRDYYVPLGLWLDVSAYPLAEGLALYFRDVTAEELVRQKIAKDEKLIAAQAALLDIAPDAIIVRRLDHTIDYWNSAAEELYGWSAEEAVGRSIRDLVDVDPTALAIATAAAVRDGSWTGELEQVTKDGRLLLIDCRLTVVRDSDGQPHSIFSVNANLTEKRRKEQRDLRAQRMESLGTLAGGVAHDLNNVLTPILMSVQMLAREETDTSRSELLATMESSVKRGADMIRQVLSFARGAEGRRIEVDLNRLLTELSATCREFLPPTIEFSVSAPSELWTTTGDPTQLLQVLLNLVTNARDALSGFGTLAVTARNVSVADSFSSLTHLADAGDYILIEVEDSGVGMSAEVMSKIFEPFYTTKGVGEGTGLGLATSAAIVQGHGGVIQVYSEPAQGTRFRIHLPANSTGPGAAHAVPSEDAVIELPRGNGELVLVVDDEAAIRLITRQTLESFGYSTAVASNGAEALEYCELAPGTVNLVFTDMMMPVMDGAELASVLRVRHPTIRVVAASGLTANSEIADAVDSGIHQFLTKPFTTAQLLQTVRAALDDGTSDEA